MLETERLILRHFCMADKDDFLEFAQDKDFGPLQGYREDIVEGMAKNFVMFGYSHPNRFAIFLKDEKKVIGLIELMDPHHNRFSFDLLSDTKELGIGISKNYRNKGYMSEALEVILSYAFNKLGLTALYACNSSFNEASSYIQEKYGFKKVASHEYNGEEIIERTLTKEDYNLKLVRDKK